MQLSIGSYAMAISPASSKMQNEAVTYGSRLCIDVFGLAKASNDTTITGAACQVRCQGIQEAQNF
jgi:hypothetical protein